jgi:hypothetical protein
MDERESQTSIPPESEGETLEWLAHPVRRKPLVSVAVTILIFVAAAIVFFSTNSMAFTLLALVVLAASLAKFYFPTRYRMTEKRLIVKTTTQTLSKEWKLYRNFYPDRNGILLSPFARQTRLENFRGLYILFSDNKDEVTAFVKRRLGTQDGSDISDPAVSKTGRDEA